MSGSVLSSRGGLRGLIAAQGNQRPAAGGPAGPTAHLPQQSGGGGGLAAGLGAMQQVAQMQAMRNRGAGGLPSKPQAERVADPANPGPPKAGLAGAMGELGATGETAPEPGGAGGGLGVPSSASSLAGGVRLADLGRDGEGGTGVPPLAPGEASEPGFAGAVHLAALGRDGEGGTGVAPLQPDMPQDVPVSLSVSGETPGFARGGLGVPRPRVRRVGSHGLVHSATPGRADLVPARMRRGSYVVPADVVSSLGQGNTLAGARVLHASLPEAAEMAARGPVARAAGGLADVPDEIEVRLSGGEYQVSPEQVLAIGRGDVGRGAEALDRLVHTVRAQTRDQLARMPPPK